MKEILLEIAKIRIENDWELMVAAYTDNIIIMTKKEDDLKRVTHELIKKWKKKYTIITRCIRDNT